MIVVVCGQESRQVGSYGCELAAVTGTSWDGKMRNAGEATAIRGMAGVSEVGGWRFAQH